MNREYIHDGTNSKFFTKTETFCLCMLLCDRFSNEVSDTSCYNTPHFDNQSSTEILSAPLPHSSKMDLHISEDTSLFSTHLDFSIVAAFAHIFPYSCLNIFEVSSKYILHLFYHQAVHSIQIVTLENFSFSHYIPHHIRSPFSF